MAFDGAGNNTKRWVAPATLFQSFTGEANNVFDAENRLTKTTTVEGDTEYLYGPDGARLLQRDKTGVTLFKGDDQIKSTPDGNLTGQRTYSFASKTVAIRITNKNTNRDELSPVWTDLNNTPTAQITTTNQLARMWSQPYGNPRGPQPTTWAGTTGYLSGTNTPTTGAIHLGDRDLDPMVARFLQPDRILEPENPLSHSPYLYGWGNPLDKPDPTGLMPMQNRQMGDFGPRGELTFAPKSKVLLSGPTAEEIPHSTWTKAWDETISTVEPGWSLRETEKAVADVRPHEIPAYVVLGGVAHEYSKSRREQAGWRTTEEQEALRHQLFASTLTVTLGESDARIWLDAHEGTDGQISQYRRDSERDRGNNERGVAIGRGVSLVRDSFRVAERSRLLPTSGLSENIPILITIAAVEFNLATGNYSRK